MSLPSRRAIDIREALGLDQDEMGALLGVNLRTVSRLEAFEGAKGGLGAALILLEQLPLNGLSAALAKLGAAVGGKSESEARLLAAGARHALQRVVDLLPEQRRAATEEMTLAELIAEAWGKGRFWVYWATSAGTSGARTLALADQGVIARSISGNGLDVQPYLFKLRPGDQILLCHDGRPLGWYRLRSAEVPPDLPGRSAGGDRPLPPVFRVLACSSELGKQLAADGYPRFDGTRGPSRKPCTALAVTRMRIPPHKAPPEPRRPGDRFTVTPYFKREQRQ